MLRMGELVERAQETLSGRRVFGDAIQQGGVTVIPAADLAGGGGGGSGQDENGQESVGGGYGLRARPAGVYVIEGGRVSWRPAVDVNRLASTLAGLAAAFMFYRWRLAVLDVRRGAVGHTRD